MGPAKAKKKDLISELDARLTGRVESPGAKIDDGRGGEEEAETALQNGQRVSDESETQVPGMVPASEDAAKDELPPVEELVKRLPPEVLATLDELFRANWTEVKRIRPGALKSDEG